MKDSYISFYELSRELMSEDKKEGHDYKNEKDESKKRELEKKFENYRKTKLKYFKEIFGDKYQDGKTYSIPIEEKEIVKMAIRGYTRKYYNHVRNRKIPSFEDTIDYVKKMEEAIGKSDMNEEKRDEYALDLYGILELESKKASMDVYKDITEIVKENIENIKVKQIEVNGELKDKIRDLNDYDAKLLIMYYKKLVINITNQWNELCDIVGELRMEDVLNVSDEQLKFNDDIVCLNKKVKRSINIIKEAINIFNEESKLHELPIEVKKLTIDEKKRLSKISELFK